jgi:hypothetical protein
VAHDGVYFFSAGSHGDRVDAIVFIHSGGMRFGIIPNEEAELSCAKMESSYFNSGVTNFWIFLLKLEGLSYICTPNEGV